MQRFNKIQNEINVFLLSFSLFLFFPIKNAIFLISYAYLFFDRAILGKMCFSSA